MLNSKADVAASIGGVCWRESQGCFYAGADTDKDTASFSCFPPLQKISQVCSSLLHKLLSYLRSYQRNKSFQQSRDAKHRNAIKVAKGRCRAPLELYSMSSSDSKPWGVLVFFAMLLVKGIFLITHLQQRKFCSIDRSAWEGGKKKGLDVNE